VLLLAVALSLQAQPRVQGFTLANGLRVLHLEEHEHPLVRARLYLRIEAGDVPADRPGLPLLLHRMFESAETADLRAGELERTLEDSGIQLSPSLEAGGFAWCLVARSRDQDRAMGLLADRLLRTLLDPGLLETQRQACRRRLERPEGPARTRVRQALIQDPASGLTLTSLSAISLEDLLGLRAKVFRPDRALLVLHGDLGLEQAKRLVLLSLGPWTAQASPGPEAVASRLPPASALPPPAVAPRIALPGAALQIQVAAPQPGDLTPETGELLKLLVPGDGSLLPARVAIQNGWLVASLDGGAGAPAPGVESLLKERLEAFRQRGFTEVDLERARIAWRARRSLDSLHPAAQMDRALAEALGRGAMEDRLKAVTLEMLNAGLRRWLDPAAFRIGASGDPDELKSLPTP
jgi:predicted Zn-dependent peptidase